MCAMSTRKINEEILDDHFDSADYAGEIVPSDVMGKMPTALDESEHMVIFVDQHTQWMTMAGMVKK